MNKISIYYFFFITILSLQTILAAFAQQSTSNTLTQNATKQNFQIKDSLLKHLDNLTKPSMEGLKMGSLGDKIAATYIAEQLRQYGLIPAGDNNTFFQIFTSNTSQKTKYPNEPNITGSNIIALLPGNDKNLKDNFIIVTLHRNGYGYNPEGKVCPSASKAYEIALLLETARLLAQIKPARSIIFIVYGANSEPYTLNTTYTTGLSYFVSHPTIPLSKLVAIFSVKVNGFTKSAKIKIDNLQLYPDIILETIEKSSTLNQQIVLGNIVQTKTEWSPKIPQFILTSVDPEENSSLYDFISPLEETANRLNLDKLSNQPIILSELINRTASIQGINQLNPLYREYLATTYQTLSVDLAPSTDLHKKIALAVDSTTINKIEFYIQNTETDLSSQQDKFQQILDGLIALNKTINFFSEKLYLVETTTKLVPTNKIGILPGTYFSNIFSKQPNVETLIKLKENGLRIVYVSEDDFKIFFSPKGLHILQILQTEGIKIFLHNIGNNQLKKILQLTTIAPLLISDTSLSDIDIKELINAGHFIVILPTTQTIQTNNDEKHINHILNILATTDSSKNIIVSNLTYTLASKLAVELAKRNFSPKTIQTLFGENFFRFLQNNNS